MLIKHNERHGFTTRTTKSRLYVTWQNMKRRCKNKNAEDYSRYGARGIRVCKTWEESFVAFKDWALANGYADEMTIDRIDSTKAYCPENCRFVPKYINCREGKITTKLSMEKARIIRKMRAEGIPAKAIAHHFSVAENTVRSVLQNVHWKERSEYAQ